jgi:hypothetical protein
MELTREVARQLAVDGGVSFWSIFLPKYAITEEMV